MNLSPFIPFHWPPLLLLFCESHINIYSPLKLYQQITHFLLNSSVFSYKTLLFISPGRPRKKWFEKKLTKLHFHYQQEKQQCTFKVFLLHCYLVLLLSLNVWVILYLPKVYPYHPLFLFVFKYFFTSFIYNLLSVDAICLFIHLLEKMIILI